MKKFYTLPAFTLAEVLITLGIIGVVAAMTIPTLINNYQKQVVVTKLQKFYSSMTQAIKLSEIDNGPAGQWDYGPANSGSSANTLTWFNTYLKPYIKTVKVEAESASSGTVRGYFADGSCVAFSRGNYMDFYYLTDCYNKTSVTGKNTFFFEMIPEEKTNVFRPFDPAADASKIGTREYWTTGTDACTTSGNKTHCAGLIMYDGWQIKDDYPFFN